VLSGQAGSHDARLARTNSGVSPEANAKAALAVVQALQDTTLK